MEKLLNKIFEGFSPYIPGEQPQEENYIKLNTNENPFPPPKKIIDEIKRGIDSSIKKYPDPLCLQLRKTISKCYDFPVEDIFAGNGSDEILRLCITAFSSVKEKIVFLYPSYPLYEVLTIIADRKPVKIKTNNDFSIPARFITGFTDCMKIIANPDSPSGRFHSVETIEEIVKKSKRVVVIDEAYVDFAKENCLGLVKKYKNVVVTRSFSKSFSLAGIRLGYCFASSELIQALMSIKDSYNLNAITQYAGIIAMKNYPIMKKNCEKIIRIRKFLEKELIQIGFNVFPSSTNFLLVEPPDKNGKLLYEKLKEKKILVRYFNNIPCLHKYVRITIGNIKDTKNLLKVIREFYAKII